MRLIPINETISIEFKSDLKKLEDNDLIEAIVGLANTSGGELYLGVEDDGKITGLHKDHMNTVMVAAFIANKTVPPQAVRVEVLDEEKPVLKIEVPMSRAIVATTSGKILRRRLKANGEPENVPLYPYEVNSRLSELGLLDYSAQPIVGATLNDFDPLERERLRKIIRIQRGEAELLELNDEELDKALRFIVDYDGKLIPTVTGMLLLGKVESLNKHIPTAKISFQVLEGTDVKVNDIFIKPLLAAFEILEDYMKAWNPEKEMEIGLLRIPIPEFDKRAFREALVNAFSHRDYSLLKAVRFLIDDEGLTISSPGGFIEGVTLKNLLSVEPHGRNPALADALKRIGLAERTGRGIDRIYEGSIVYGRPLPDYTESDENNVKLFIQRAEPDRAFAKMISDEQNRLGRSLPINSLLVLSSLRQERRLNIERIAEITNLNENRAKAVAERLAEAGLVEASGNNRGRFYILSSKIYKDNNNLIGYVRQTDIDKLRYPELIMKLTKKQGYITRKNVAELLHIAEPQAYRLLKKLADEDKIVLEGKGRHSKYILSKSTLVNTKK
jgi:ATP-dependent DNA helicase RecG